MSNYNCIHDVILAWLDGAQDVPHSHIMDRLLDREAINRTAARYERNPGLGREEARWYAADDMIILLANNEDICEEYNI